MDIMTDSIVTTLSKPAKLLGALAAALAALSFSGCSGGDSDAGAVSMAIAELQPTEGNQTSGTVTFIEQPDGVMVVVDIANLSEGKHGFHVHEFGDCSAPDGTSAGGHFNPTGHDHAGPDAEERHVGDMGNIEANELGVATMEWVDSGLSLSGPNSILGRSVIVHANEDDLSSQPTGNAGPRLACGVIELVRN